MDTRSDIMDNTSTWVKIVIIVIVVMGLLWWNSDNSRIKWIHELEDTISEYEEKIAALESENKSMSELLEYYDLY